jgi:acyl-coenzyme A synthetase/AMP-(fatty) acid ligase
MFEKIVDFQAQYRPNEVAISTPVGDATFRQLYADVNRMARRLRPIVPARGVIAVQAGNPGLHWVILLALARLGCVSASLPTVGERPEAELLGILTPEFLLTDRDPPQTIVPSFHLSPDWIEETFQASAEPLEPHAFAPDDPVRIVLSSGTTGTPKKMAFTMKVVDERIKVGGMSQLAQRRLHVAVGLDTETGFRSPLDLLGPNFYQARGSIAWCSSPSSSTLCYAPSLQAFRAKTRCTWS